MLISEIGFRLQGILTCYEVADYIKMFELGIVANKMLLDRNFGTHSCFNCSKYLLP